jgi:hypothetical protein
MVEISEADLCCCLIICQLVLLHVLTRRLVCWPCLQILPAAAVPLLHLH